MPAAASVGALMSLLKQDRFSISSCSAAVLGPYSAPVLAPIRCLDRGKQAGGCVVRVVHNDAKRLERVLQGGANGVNRGCATFPHAFGAVEGEWRRSFDMPIEQARHIDCRDRGVIAEGAGQQVSG